MLSSKKEINLPIIRIAGPTAVGKTAICIQLAQELNAEIIGADSRQFYKEMSIGTAKPNSQELAQVPHHLVDFLSIHEEYNVGDYERDVAAKIVEIRSENKNIIITGGSGLFLQAAIEGLDELPEADPQLRAGLEKKAYDEGIHVLQDQLKALDPIYYQEVDINNPHRLIRAIEVCLLSGKTYTELRKNNKEKKYPSIDILLERDREGLYHRINQRVELMIEKGLVEEVTSLKANESLRALNTVGYQEIFDHLNGKISLEEAIAKIKQNTRRFAKRQLTWFRNRGDYTSFHPDNLTAILYFIKAESNPLL
ncbi:MAG: tRNA (adenosine(37)-N6)-dimethylallyltransferase MiaA [Cyclobacteriaceae bacterium]|nr:tRNA (adenosine(37)-N6)-dimethylallyltransferase MiaA [Cyclobacteriaceae bacterium]MCH8516575.1 tRNA (adenosine(37)-N6)-dimethylallyltransferase MiaA [Cyclobacteriaceae bacterium]